MVLLMADTRVPPEGLGAKLAELNCFIRHSLPPFGSADRFSETANLMVNIGFRLNSR